MPSAPRRPCSSPGCRDLCDEGSHCPQHRRQRDEQRGTPPERGYDADHRKLRLLCFQRDAWRCVVCGWEPDIVAACRRFELGDPPSEKVLDELRARVNRGERHLHADHRVPIAIRPDLRLVLGNLQTLCDQCHNRKTRIESRGPGYR